jgi:hypothetical protein
MLAVLEQRVFDGLGAIDEQAAIKAVLLLGDPLAALVAADEDDGRCRAARGRFDEFHVSQSFSSQSYALNVRLAGYEIERERRLIS